MARGLKQYSPAFERNREPIGGALDRALDGVGTVLEIGSGSGQHAVWFARRFPHITWFPTEVADNLASVDAWRTESDLANLRPPLELDVLSDRWPAIEADAVVTINTLHIMPWPATPKLFAEAATLLPPGGVIFVYGPFRYAARPLEPSNARFDGWLQAQDPGRGLREFETVDAVARDHGFVLLEDLPMPSNNRSAWWRKAAG